MGNGALVLLAVVFAVLAARLLGIGGRGQVSALLIGSGLLGLLAELGLRTVITRQVASGRATWTESVATAGALYAGMCAVVLPPIGLLLLHIRGDFFWLAGIPPTAIFLALWTVPIGLAEGALTGALNGHHRTPEVTVVQIAERVAVTLAFVGLVGMLGWGITGAMAAQLIGGGIGVTTALLLLARMPRGRWRVRRALLPEFLRSGPAFYSANLATALNYRLDGLLIFVLLGKYAAGAYAVAASIAELPLSLPASIAAVLLPVASRDGDTRARTLRLARFSVLVIGVVSVVLVCVGRPLLVFLFGPAFAQGYLPLVLLLPGILVLGVNKVVVAELLGRGHAKASVVSSWTALVATVTLDVLLIPRFGIAGAAAASSVAYLVSGIVLLDAYRRLTGVHPLRLFAVSPRELLGYSRRLRVSLAQRRKDAKEVG